MRKRPVQHPRIFPPLSLLPALLVLALATASHAQDEIDREFEFMSGLIKWGMADYAERALEKVLLRHPDQKERAKVIEAEIEVSRRNFEKAEEIAGSLPPDSETAHTIKLAIANGYYRQGEIEKAKQLYEAFFARFGDRAPEGADLRRFFQESAYRYAQMLEQAGDKEGAARAYDRVLQSGPEREVARPLMMEQAQLYVALAREHSGGKRDAFLNRASELIEELQWGGIDIWFGKSIASLAHIELVRGNRERAREVLAENMDILKQIDDLLEEQDLDRSISPMAGARYLGGEIHEEQANALERAGKKKEAQDHLIKAFTEYYNVFAKYSGSEWAAKAGVKANEMKGRLEGDYGRRIKVKLPQGQQRVKVGAQQFRLADTLYRQKKYEDAIAEYLKVVNQFPDSDQTPRVLSNVMQAYAQLGDPLMVKVVAEYLGERFSGDPSAARALLLAGKHYLDAKDEPMYMFCYETYLKHFPEHERAAGVLFSLAGLRRRAGDDEGRMRYLRRILTDYQEDQYYLRTLQMLAWDAYRSERFDEAVHYFQRFVEEEQPGLERAKAQFAMADAHFRSEEYIPAVKAYTELIRWLDPDDTDNPYNTSPEARRENANILEKAHFQQANGLSLIQAPPERQAALYEKGIERLDHFLETYPDSSLAPKAMAGKGRLYLALGQFDAATRTFNTLASAYPQSEEGKSALYSLIKAAMEVEKVQVAKEAFGRMLANAQAYTPAEFARVGQLMFDVASYPEAIQAYRKVLEAQPEERALLERALFGMGKAYYELGQYAEAAEPLEALMTKYPKSGLFYDAKFALAESYLKTGQLAAAEEALTDIFRYASKPELINEASYQLGVIQREADEQEKAYASFQRVALLANPENREVRPIIEKCLWESIILGAELERFSDVIESCDQYLQLFPESERVERVRELQREARLSAAQPVAAVE